MDKTFMGSSFTEFKGFGFWSRDHLLEEWLRELAEEGRKQTPLPHWLASACEHWDLQSTGIFTGWIHANLDEILIDSDRLSLVIASSEKVKGRYPPEHQLHRMGNLFVRLLKSELTTDASSPLDYMVSDPRE